MARLIAALTMNLVELLIDCLPMDILSQLKCLCHRKLCVLKCREGGFVGNY